jgi:hypothetical protein
VYVMSALDALSPMMKFEDEKTELIYGGHFSGMGYIWHRDFKFERSIGSEQTKRRLGLRDLLEIETKKQVNL